MAKSIEVDYRRITSNYLQAFIGGLYVAAISLNADGSNFTRVVSFLSKEPLKRCDNSTEADQFIKENFLNFIKKYK